MTHTDNPAPLLEAAFRRIQAERMADVPILNPALSVEALGFSRWQGHWLGVLVTPWFMNLVLVRASEAGWRSAADGERVFHRFPSGDYAFLGGREPELGEFQTCALFSPMGQFADQDSARAVAGAALERLHVAAAGKAPPPVAMGPGNGADMKGIEEGVPQRAMSKREFLNRVLLRRPD